MTPTPLHILRDVNGKPTAFPSAAMPVVIGQFAYDAQRMGGAPAITATFMYPRCLDDEWTRREYVEYAGERFYVRQTPSSYKGNDDRRFKHEVSFVSEREILENVYFLDVVTADSGAQYQDRYRSNTTKVHFYGDITEFVARINDSLIYSGLYDTATGSGYRVVIDEGISSATAEVSLEDVFVAEALQEIYNVYKLAYYWVGKTCHVGYEENAITTPLAYGVEGAFLSVQKANANYRFINRITGTGGSDNLPYYYPNLSPSGTAVFSTENIPQASAVNVDLDKVLAYNPGALQDRFVLASRPASMEFSLKQSDAYFASFCYNPFGGGSLFGGNGTLLSCIAGQQLFEQTVLQPAVWICDNRNPIYFKACACFVFWLEAGGVYTFLAPQFTYNPDVTALGGACAVLTSWNKVHVSDFPLENGGAETALRGWLPQADNYVDLFRDNGEYSPSGFSQLGDGLVFTPLQSGYHAVVVQHYAKFASQDVAAVKITGLSLGGRFRLSGGSDALVSAGGQYSFTDGTEGVGFMYGDGQWVAYSESGITLQGADTLQKAQFVASTDGYGRVSLDFVQGSEDGAAAVAVTGRQWVEPVQSLMPSVYRESGGAQRFYDALNGTYGDGSGGFVVFNNPFGQGNPREGMASFPDICPSIEGMKNAEGQLLGQVAAIAFDANDSDALKSGSDEYLHSFFYVKLHVFNGTAGFNLFEYVLESSQAEIKMTSGNCAACSFPIMVDKVLKGGQYVFRNPVTTDDGGNLVKSGAASESGFLGDYIPAVRNEGDYVGRQQDTSLYEVWVALRKETGTFGVIMPNASQGYRPAVGDSFVITGISLPQTYILEAEKRLDDALIAYMKANNDEKFTFNVKLSRIFFANNSGFAAKLNENARLLVEYNARQYVLYVSSFSCKADGNALYEVNVDLSDSLAVSQSSLKPQLDSIKAEILASLPGMRGDVLAQGLRYFLRKDTADAASGVITFLSGLLLGDGSHGIDGGGNASLASVKAAVAELAEAAIAKVTSEVSFERVATFLSGALTEMLESPDFVEGLAGFGLHKTESGRYRLEVDELLVRVKAIFNELEIRKLSYAGGSVDFSAAGSTIVRVRPLVREGEAEPYAWRCFFMKDDGTTRTRNWWHAGDMAKCQTFNLDGAASPTARLLSLAGRLISADAAGSPLGYGAARQGNAGNRYYWRLVTATGSETLDDGREYDYADLSNEKEVVLTDASGVEVRCQGYDEVFDGFDDSDSGMKWHADANDAPQAGDEIVQQGSQTDPERQHLIRITVVGENAPALEEYVGIGRHDGKGVYNLSARRMTQIAPRTGNVFRARRFEVETEGGAVTRLPVYRGEWQQGVTYYYYEQVRYGGGLWLCVSQAGTQAEPADGSAAWQRQVDPGKNGTDGNDGAPGTPGKDGTDGALSAVRAFFTPQSAAVSDAGDGFDLSGAEFSMTVVRGFEEEITGGCSFSFYGIGCTVEVGAHPYQCRITGISGQPSSVRVQCRVTVPAQWAGGSPATMTAYADVAVNYPGQFRETIENDVKRQVASKEFSYYDEHGDLQQVAGVSELVQSAEGLRSEVWRRQPAGSVLSNGTFASGLDSWAVSGGVEAAVEQGVPCARLAGEGAQSLEQRASQMLCDWGAVMGQAADVGARLSLRVLTPTGCTVRASLLSNVDGELASWGQAFAAGDGWQEASAVLAFSNVPTSLAIEVTAEGSLSTSMECCLADVQLVPDIDAVLGSRIQQTAEGVEVSVVSLEQGIADTGINITDRKIVATADNFEVRNNSGEQTMRVGEDGMLNVRQLKVDTADASNKARVEVGVDADGNPYLTGYNKDGQAVWTFDGDIALNYGDGVLMQILATSEVLLTKPNAGVAEHNKYTVEYRVRVLVTNQSNEALAYDGGALQCRADDWRSAGGTDYITLPITGGPAYIPVGGSDVFVFGATIVYSLEGESVYDPALDYGGTTDVSAWYNKPGAGWRKVSATPVPFTKATLVAVGSGRQ